MVVRIAASVLAALLALALAAELALGTWFSHDPWERLNLSRDVSMGLSARDHWGLRAHGGDPGSILILTLGGSATLQSSLSDDLTWQAQLRRAFAQDGQEVAVGNAGIDGQSSVGMAAALEDWLPLIPGLHPRFVLALVGREDALGGLAEADHMLIAPSPRSRSFLLRKLLGPQKAAESGTSPPNAVEPYKDRLRRIAQRIHNLGAVPVFLTQPGGGRAVESFNQATRQVCRDEGLLCLDSARDAGFGVEDVTENGQFSAAGAEKMGRWLYGKLAGLV